MPRGGARPGAGKPKGYTHKAKPPAVLAQERQERAIQVLTREEAAMRALEYIYDAYEALRAVMNGSESPAARVAAATAILDRALGKPREAPPAPLEGETAKDITPGLNGHGKPGNGQILKLDDFTDSA